MQKISTTQAINTVSDSTKGQKITAALYLVTNHLSENDPLKAALRDCAVTLVEHAVDGSGSGERAVNLLKAAALAHIISEQNVAVLIQEIGRYIGGDINMPGSVLGTLFDETRAHTVSVTTKGRSLTTMSYMSDRMDSPVKNHTNVIENKNKRQHEILTFINTRKSAGIKDIAALFPDVSEKTIQRELGTLVENGKITKRGLKRWSLYMAVGEHK